MTHRVERQGLRVIQNISLPHLALVGPVEVFLRLGHHDRLLRVLPDDGIDLAHIDLLSRQ